MTKTSKTLENSDAKKFHPTSVPGATPHNLVLGKQIAQMRYDQVSHVLTGMSLELERQSTSDLKRGRVQLAKLLEESKKQVDELNEVVKKMFRISKPYMEHELLNSEEKERGRGQE